MTKNEGVFASALVIGHSDLIGHWDLVIGIPPTVPPPHTPSPYPGVSSAHVRTPLRADRPPRRRHARSHPRGDARVQPRAEPNLLRGARPPGERPQAAARV